MKVLDSVRLRQFEDGGPDRGRGTFIAMAPNGRRAAYLLSEADLQEDIKKLVLYVLDLSSPDPGPAAAAREVFRTRPPMPPQAFETMGFTLSCSLLSILITEKSSVEKLLPTREL